MAIISECQIIYNRTKGFHGLDAAKQNSNNGFTKGVEVTPNDTTYTIQKD